MASISPLLKVLVVMGHPRTTSFVAALARAYSDGASQAGVEVRILNLPDLAFDPHVRVTSPEQQPLEPDLRTARDLLAWADHLVFAYPTWWGTMPALLKGFLDRLIMPGFAFRFYGPRATDWQALWHGKSAQLIITMDTPPPIYRWLYGAPGVNAMRRATLGFCGVKPVHVMVCGPMRTSTRLQRKGWLEHARRAGFRLCNGADSYWRRGARQLLVWLKALRLQFYPMSWAAYTIGALAAGFAAEPYAWGYLFLFFLEASTVFCNDYFDFDSDCRNAHFGPFTGGSRVLVTGELSFTDLRGGIGVTLTLSAAAAALAIRASPAPLAGLVLLPIAAALTLGYTVPPLRLTYRNLGELDVAFTHSVLVLLFGYLVQGGTVVTALPWLLALPLFWAILPAIILAGVPDRHADAAVGKHTVAERFGVPAALLTAAGSVIVALLLAVVFDRQRLAGGAFGGISYFAVPHAALCLVLLHRQWQRHADTPLARIDLLLVVTLSYMIWFVAVPFYHLL